MTRPTTRRTTATTRAKIVNDYDGEDEFDFGDRVASYSNMGKKAAPAEEDSAPPPPSTAVGTNARHESGSRRRTAARDGDGRRVRSGAFLSVH